jgi:hypothetical protein
MMRSGGVVKRMSIGLVATASAAFLLAAAIAPSAWAVDSSDEAVGSGSNQFLVVLGDARLSVSAHSSALGESPSGEVRAQGDPDGAGPMEPFKLEGEVTCLRVSGNRAAIKYRFKHAEGSAAPFEGGGVQIFLEDNGDPTGGEAVDRTTFDPPQSAPFFDLDATRCDDPNARLSYDGIESGNFRVADATP